MLSALFTAIQTKYTGNAALVAALPGGLYQTEAPAGWTTYPYGTYFIVSAVPEYTFTHTIEQPVIQFNIFDDDASDATLNDVEDKLTTLFDNCTLTVTGYSFISMIRRNTFHLREDDVWQLSVEYQIRIVA